MNLQELFDKTMIGEPEARVRNTKTAVKILSKALGHDSPQTCPEEAFRRPLKHIFALVEQALAGKGPHTIRNVKNYLSHLLRKADTTGVLSLAKETLTPRFSSQPPLRTGGQCSSNNRGYYLTLRNWPTSFRQEWEEFCQWATAPLVPNRPAKWRKRPITLAVQLKRVEMYVGYLTNVRKMTNLQFNQLLDAQLVSNFVHWHVNTVHRKVTASIECFLSFVLMLARQYRPNKEFQEKIKEIKQNLGSPTPVYDKKEAWVPLADLERVGLALWPKKQPSDIRSNGAIHAIHATISLIIRLLCRIPYRQRNIREMQLGENLYRNATGRWVLRFKGEQLKIAQKKGRENIFELPFPPDLVPQLEEYLQTWRPRICGPFPPTQLVFPSWKTGKSYRMESLGWSIKRIVARYTGKAFYPHLIRTVWATEYIRTTGDFYGAAVMLNDTIETVVASYSQISEQGVAEKAYAWVNQQFAGPTAPPKKEAA